MPAVEKLPGRTLLANTYYVLSDFPGRLPTKNPFRLASENLPVGMVCWEEADMG